MSVKFFADTNILVYVFDTGEPEKQRIAQELLRTDGSKGNIVISTQVLQEFFVAVTRKLCKPLHVNTAFDAVRSFAGYPIVQINKQLIFRSIQRYQSDGISFWDALIVESALKSGCKTLLTEDMQDGRNIEKLVIINPFK